MLNNADFSKRLQKVIEYYSESASSFAEKIGVQRSSISHILSGRNKPSLEFVLKVLSSFPEVELYWLMNGKGEFPKIESQNRQEPIAPVSKKDDQNLFTDSKNENPVEPKNSDLLKNLNHKSSNGKIIERIVIFYSDGSFSNFENS
ncbi:helix-turn-helix domain-containing protein [Olleya namhaensis]|uniref:DNA-binding transcriptional regulator, XRE-family HTH domain n=2 Tax=Olleya TaxID=336276 RepID=A0A1I3RDF7_9FLAO|nr:helix-turn-helix transcriptional regulator [Olleya namhaensis]SFJ43862.1 DNA-binding transcriptional regulator, XRE-family HTH domain [Olleya namhaensis]